MSVAHIKHSQQNYRPDIDGLRAVAVLSVIAYHAFPGWVVGGFIGVDIFFVISGYLITKNILEDLNKKTFTYSSFYSRRIVRIFPALIVVLTFCFIFGWFGLFSDEYKQLGKHIASSAGFILNFVLWKEIGYFDNTAETKPLLHLWSLGIEEQFYLLWPLILLIALKLKKVFIVILFLASCSFIINIKSSWEDVSAAYYSPITRIWELFIGAGLAHYKVSLKNKLALGNYTQNKFNSGLNLNKFFCYKNDIIINFVAFFGLLIIFFGIFYINASFKFPGYWALIPVCGASLIIAFSESSWISKKVLSNRAFVWVGLISFPLYLWHWPLLTFARIVQNETISILARLGIIFLTFILAHLTYKYIESPFRTHKHLTKKSISLLIVLFFIGCFGFHLFVRDGYEFRNSVSFYINNKNELIRSPAYDNECKNYVGLTSPLFDYCRYSDVNSNETVAVIGDSHAHASYPGISEFLRRKGVNTLLLANSSCPPFIGIYTGTSAIEQNNCKDKIEQLIGIVEKRIDISKIFIFTRGDVYISNDSALTEKRSLFGGGFVTSENLATAASQTFKRLIQSGKSVYYVTENPGLIFPAGACVNRPFKPVVRDCSVDKIAVIKRQSDYVNAFTNLSDVTIIQSIDGFCPKNRCEVFDNNGYILYADSHHLSFAGSIFQVEKILIKFL